MASNFYTEKGDFSFLEQIWFPSMQFSYNNNLFPTLLECLKKLTPQKSSNISAANKQQPKEVEE